MTKTATATSKSKAKASAKTAAKAKPAARRPAKTASKAVKAPAKTAAKAPTKAAKTAKAPPKPAAKAPAKAARPAPKAAKPAAKQEKPAAAAKPKAAAPKAPAKPIRRRGDFGVDDYIVYPTHGVGRVTAIEDQEVAGLKLQLFVIDFDKEKMTLRVPVAKAASTGMRQLSSPDKMRSALATLKGRARVKRTMWSRRAQEYEAKINSGDPVSIAEVVRDLHRAAGQPEQSYSERQIYEAALDRLSRELAAVEGLNEDQANERLEKMLRAA